MLIRLAWHLPLMLMMLVFSILRGYNQLMLMMLVMLSMSPKLCTADAHDARMASTDARALEAPKVSPADAHDACVPGLNASKAWPTDAHDARVASRAWAAHAEMLVLWVARASPTIARALCAGCRDAPPLGFLPIRFRIACAEAPSVSNVRAFKVAFVLPISVEGSEFGMG